MTAVDPRHAGQRPLVPAPLRSHLNSNGDPKVKYGKEAAERNAKRLGKDAYECTVCEWYHIGGHRPPDGASG